MPNDPPLSGVLPTLVTPLHPDGSLNEEAVAKLLGKIYAAGCHDVYVAGTTGEGLLLPLELRERLAITAVKHSAGKTVVVHVGTLATQDAIRLARHAADAGATAISSLPPAGLYGFAELKTYTGNWQTRRPCRSWFISFQRSPQPSGVFSISLSCARFPTWPG